MNHLYWLRSLGVLCAALFLAQLSPLAHAALLSPTTASDGTSQSTYEGLISTGDLLHGLTPTYTEQADQVGGFSFSVNGINDGTATSGGGATDTYYQGAANFGATHNLNLDPTVTYTFDTSVNTLGYNINSIQSIYGWQDNQSFSDQDYTITYTLVGSSTPVLLGNVAFNPFNPATDQSGGAEDSSWADLTNLGLSGVSSISFQFTPYTSPGGREQGAQLIREIDVFGEATTVPEPATWAMLLLGGFAFLAALTWRRCFA
jgi:hypothetical protein